MSSRHSRIRALALATLLLPLAAQAAPAPRKPGSQTPLTHRQIIDRANNLMTAFSSEIALQQGKGSDALAAYMRLFRRTNDPAVAERAVDIALAGSSLLHL